VSTGAGKFDNGELVRDGTSVFLSRLDPLERLTGRSVGDELESRIFRFSE